MRYSWFAKIPLFAFIGAAVVFILGLIVMTLWNALVPALFQGPVITLWQAIGLFVLGKILFNGWRFHRHPGSWWYGRYPGYWKYRFEEKLAKMTPEEREKFKEEWRKRCSPRYWHHHGHGCCEPEEGDSEKKE